MVGRRFLFWIYLFVLTLLGPVGTVFAGQNATGTLTVVVSDFQSGQGYAMVALCDSKENYEQGNDQAFATSKGKITNNAAKVVFKNLPYGEYAIKLYHDRNSNGELDTDDMGVPKEPYAFSNNARGIFDKPDWHKVVFKLDAPQKKIDIFLH